MKKEKNVYKELLIYIPVAMLCFAIFVVLILPSGTADSSQVSVDYKSLDKSQYSFEGNKLGDTNLEYNYTVTDQYINQLEKQKEYTPGKVNPFSGTTGTTTGNDTDVNNGTTTGTGGTTAEQGSATK